MVFATKPKERMILTREGADKLLAQKPMQNHREFVKQSCSKMKLVNDVDLKK